MAVRVLLRRAERGSWQLRCSFSLSDARTRPRIVNEQLVVAPFLGGSKHPNLTNKKPTQRVGFLLVGSEGFACRFAAARCLRHAFIFCAPAYAFAGAF
jgi:hypothetical protein